METDLTGRRVVVIGAGSGIGRALAVRAAQAGAELVLAGRRTQQLDQTAGELPGSPRVHQVDLADEDSVAALARAVGEFDHLVSTANGAATGPVRDLDPADVRRALDAKITGPLLLAKHTADRIAPDGSLTFFSGYAAWRPAPGRVVMATANGALAFLVPALAVELAPVRVNAISPGVVDSGVWDGLGARKDEFLTGVAERNPVRRVGTPDDLAQAALHLMTSGFTTGTVLHVDGGGRFA